MYCAICPNKSPLLIPGLGHGIGGAVGGIVYEKYGPQVMLAEAMLTVAIGWIAMTALRMFKSASDAHRQPVAAEQ